MKALKDFNNVEASTSGSFESLPAGGYVVKILSAVDHAGDKPFLEITYDISEGQYAGYFDSDFGKKNEWAHTFRAYYSDAAIGMFKGFIKMIDESNGTKFEEQIEAGFNEAQLVGKLVGLVIGYRQYINNRGEVKERADVRSYKTAAQIRNGKFKVPELKLLENDPKPAAPVEGFIPDESIPF